MIDFIVSFPIPELLISRFLTQHLPGFGYPVNELKVLADIPSQRNGRVNQFIRLVTVPGIRLGETSRRDSVVVECWHEDRLEAARMAEVVAGLLYEMPNEIHDVSGVEGTSPYYDPDPEESTPRYTQTVDVFTTCDVTKRIGA